MYPLTLEAYPTALLLLRLPVRRGAQADGLERAEVRVQICEEAARRGG